MVRADSSMTEISAASPGDCFDKWIRYAERGVLVMHTVEGWLRGHNVAWATDDGELAARRLMSAAAPSWPTDTVARVRVQPGWCE